MRWLLRVVFGLIALVLVAVATLFLLPAERIAQLAADRFEAATGRAMTIQGEVRPTLWPDLGVTTDAVSIANAGWSQEGPMLRAEGLAIGVDMGVLLGGSVRIKRVEVVRPEIVLEVASDGSANWDFGTSGGAQAESGSSGGVPAFTLDLAEVTDARVILVDHAAGTRSELSDIDASVRLPEFEGAVSYEVAAVMNGQAFSASGEIGAFSTFLSGGAAPVSLSATAGGSTVRFYGNAGLSPVAAGGRLDLDMSDAAAVFALLGQAAPDVPAGLGRQIKLAGDVTFTDGGAITLREGTIQLDQNRFGGGADLSISGERPRITAQLTAGGLDFAALTGGEAPPDAAGGSGWSTDPIDVSALGSVDAEISLSAESIDLGATTLGRTRILTTLDAGRAVTDIRELVAFGGTLAGSFVVNSRGGLSVRTNLTASNVALQTLLQETMGYDRLLGQGQVTLNVLGVGNSVNALMNSLSGDGQMSLGKGELRGLDLVGMLRNLDPSFVGEGAKTIFDSMSASFRINEGVLSNEDFKLTAPLLTADGKGTLGLGAQTISYQLGPTLLEGQTGGIRVPVLITGAWADPKIRLDLEALAEQELADEVEEVKQQVEEAVTEAVTEELGVTVEEGESVEDAVQDELEDRVRDGLRDLLGGD